MAVSLKEGVLRCRVLVKAHVFAIVLAFLCAFIIAVPSVIFRFDPSFKGIDFLGTDGEASYLAQIHAVYNGDFSFGNVYMYEGKDQPYLKQPLPAVITAGLGKLLGLSVPDVNLAAKFVFPFTIFFLVYALGLLLTKRKDVSLIGACFVLLSPATTALLNPHTWLPLLRHGVFVANDAEFLLYGRPINPQVSNLVFFAYLVALFTVLTRFETWESRKKWGIGALAALFLGLTFYTYVFSFTLLFVMNGAVWVYFLVRRRFKELKIITLITIGGLIIGIPYFINTFKLIASPYYPELVVRAGQVVTHDPVISLVWCGALVLFLLAYRRFDTFGIFMTTFLGAIFIVSNQQIITGRTLPIPAHYHWYYMAPLAGLLFTYILFTQVSKKISERWLSVATALACILFLVVAIVFQRWSYSVQKDQFVAWQRYAGAIEWLGQNTNKDDAVFSSDVFSSLVVVYTPANAYYNGYAGENLVAAERLREAFYTYMYLDGIPSSEAKNYFSDPLNRRNVSRFIFGNYYRAKNGCYECYPPELDQTFINEYQEFVEAPLLTNLKKYRITYAVWDKKLDPQWQLDRFFKHKVFDDGQLAIYQVEE